MLRNLCAGVLVLGLAAGCAGLKVGVTPVPDAAEPVYESVCAEGAREVACLKEGQPRHRLTFNASNRVEWVLLRPDARYLLVGMSSLAEDDDDTRARYALYDVEEQRQRWNVQLSPNKLLDTENCFFTGDVVAFFSKDGSLQVVGVEDGLERWSYKSTEKGMPLHQVWCDEENGLLVAATLRTLLFLDAATGQEAARMKRHHMGYAVNLTASPLDVRAGKQFLYDYGLVCWDREARRLDWSTRFATFGEDDHTGANVAGAIVGGILGGLTGVYVAAPTIPPDWTVGRTAAPVVEEDVVVAAALNVVHAFRLDGGERLWSAVLPVPQVSHLAVREGTVYALGGGRHVYWGGRTGRVVKEPCRSGLYGLRLEDGTAVPGFASPFNANADLGLFGDKQVRRYDEDDAWEEEEDWIREVEKAAGTDDPGRSWSTVPLRGLFAGERGLNVLTDAEVVNLDLATGAERGRQAVGVGEILHGVTVGDRVLVRAREGLAGLDRESGALLWQKRIAPLGSFKRGMSARHVRQTRTLGKRLFHDVENEALGPYIYWVDPNNGTAVASLDKGFLVGVDLDDGAPRWALPVKAEAAVAVHPCRSGTWVTVSDGATVDAHRLPDS